MYFHMSTRSSQKSIIEDLPILHAAYKHIHI